MSATSPPPDAERRTQARLSVQVPVQMRYGHTSLASQATLLDLSWGGALCQTPRALPISDRPLWLILPWALGETIEIETTLLRQKDLANGRHLLALRFERLSLLHQARLEKLLGRLQADDVQSNTPMAPVLVATLEVSIQTVDEWRWALGEIAKGRLRIRAPADFTPGQSVGLQFNGVPTRARLRLRARVLASESKAMLGIRVMRSTILTLEFEHPLEVLRQWVEWLLRQIPSDVKPSSPLADLQQQPSQSAVIPARLVLSEGERCALEIGFPEALDYLMTAWGDVSTFEVVFRQLLFGDTGASGTWTPEAWEELQLLQDVHDQVFGLSEARRIRLKVGRDVR